MPIKKALKWVAFWVSLALLINVGVYFLIPVIEKGADAMEMALKFLNCYVIEFSLSLDNLFVFLMIFSSFSVPGKLQRRALNFGIAGAVILRLAFIFAGAELINLIHWILYVFGAVLIISGVMMLAKKEKEKDYKNSSVLGVISKIIPFTGTLEGEKFFVRRDKKFYATLLFAVLIIIETSDIIFAVDSIPAAFAALIPEGSKNYMLTLGDKLIMYTANIFAILGLRSLYFVIEKLSEMFRFVKYGVAFILIFTGIKLTILIFEWTIPTVLSISIIAGTMLLSILASVVFKEKKQTAQ